MDGMEGSININLFTNDSGTLTLIVKDNGIGLPNHINLQNVDSLGLKLVGALVNQLAGKVDVDSTFGTTFTVTFVRDKHKERNDENESTSDHGC
jgi:two-component sensor histidine kinase